MEGRTKKGIKEEKDGIGERQDDVDNYFQFFIWLPTSLIYKKVRVLM